MIAIEGTNDVRRLYFGDALLPALFVTSLFFLENLCCLNNNNIWGYELPTLRVGRSVTRLAVYWAFL